MQTMAKKRYNVFVASSGGREDLGKASRKTVPNVLGLERGCAHMSREGVGEYLNSRVSTQTRAGNWITNQLCTGQCERTRSRDSSGQANA